MKVKELIERLSIYPQDDEVMILDGVNGGGSPRNLSNGPILDNISQDEGSTAGDCERRGGERVVLIGFGGLLNGHQ